MWSPYFGFSVSKKCPANGRSSLAFCCSLFTAFKPKTFKLFDIENIWWKKQSKSGRIRNRILNKTALAVISSNKTRNRRFLVQKEKERPRPSKLYHTDSCVHIPLTRRRTHFFAHLLNNCTQVHSTAKPFFNWLIVTEKKAIFNLASVQLFFAAKFTNSPAGAAAVVLSDSVLQEKRSSCQKALFYLHFFSAKTAFYLSDYCLSGCCCCCYWFFPCHQDRIDCLVRAASFCCYLILPSTLIIPAINLITVTRRHRGPL